MEAMQQNESISAEQVVEYLHQHRDFFQLREDLLTELNLPHHSQGNATSLVERQVAVLRERNIEMRHRMASMVSNAVSNDKLFANTQNLILRLLDCRNLEDCVTAVRNGFRKDFKVDHTALIIFAENGPRSGTSARFLSNADAESKINGLIKSSKGICGTLRDTELQLLFSEKAKEIQSAATMPLRHGKQTIGILALGSKNEKHFHSDMDTLFLGFIGEVLSRLINKHLGD